MTFGPDLALFPHIWAHLANRSTTLSQVDDAGVVLVPHDGNIIKDQSTPLRVVFLESPDGRPLLDAVNAVPEDGMKGKGLFIDLDHPESVTVLCGRDHTDICDAQGMCEANNHAHTVCILLGQNHPLAHYDHFTGRKLEKHLLSVLVWLDTPLRNWSDDFAIVSVRESMDTGEILYDWKVEWPNPGKRWIIVR